MIAHPPCTFLSISGARWFNDRIEEQEKALQFVASLMNAPIPRKCIENPVSVISTRICPPTQIIQPYQFGHNEAKKTCLWLFGLDPLQPTTGLSDFTEPLGHSIHYAAPGPERWKNRSRTFPGIAQAMANQWG